MIRSPLFYSGDKFKILNQIIPYIDKRARFIDPFVGGGSILANIENKEIIVNDRNTHVIKLLKYLKENNSESIIKNIIRVSKRYDLSLSAFNKYERNCDKKFFAKLNKEGHSKLREKYNQTKNIKLLLPLVLYSYNRLLRFNSKGEYNVPVGTLDVNRNAVRHIEDFHKSIKDKNISFLNKDFKEIFKTINKGDVIFVDPPYLVSHAEYNSSWSLEQEEELYKNIESAINKGAKVLLTNYLVRRGEVNKAFKKFMKNKKTIKLKSFHYSFHDNKGNESKEYLVIGEKDEQTKI